MKRPPLWFVAVVVAAMLPAVVLMPEALRVWTASVGNASYLAWLFPGWLVLSGVCACACYRERRALAWILVALMLLTAAMLLISQTAMS